jgi:hypothetical protein
MRSLLLDMPSGGYCELFYQCTPYAITQLTSEQQQRFARDRAKFLHEFFLPPGRASTNESDKDVRLEDRKFVEKNKFGAHTSHDLENPAEILKNAVENGELFALIH